MNWNDYVGKTVSILITGKDNKIENYMGVIEEVSDDGFLVLDPNNPNYSLEKLIFRLAVITSVWIYKEGKRREEEGKGGL